MMKKVIAVLLILVLAFSLSACGNSGTSNNALSKREKQFVGTWISEEEGGDLYSFRLFSSGKVIWKKYWGSSDKGILVTEEDDVNSGEWILENDRIVIFYNIAGSSEAYVLKVSDENDLTWNGHTFIKKE